MKVTVRLFGTLSQRFPHYQLEHGIEVDIPDGAMVGDLLRHLEISKSQVGIVTVKGQILKADDQIGEGDSVQIFQPLFGG